ncbi:hypothetical protein COCVIDRAFT_36802 [Bipolaris victoriae FI3]|uniref:Tyr recombinase domain-containing protein n=1 Tax=Bipolaris victoriae (strain FI3) TaxID=930091 RepID=W7EQ01_BIPV3|nr:hypothetical protein COCVIDRAFT_36802 [Bipolaris victoriae FI3]
MRLWKETGLLENNVTDVTVRNRLACLKRAVKLHTQYQYTPLQNAEIDKYIAKVLVSGKLVSTSACSKPLAPLAVAEDIIRFLFTCDEYRGLHFRLRNQLAFAIQLMLLIGVRPGEIIESDAWHRSNEGLHYKDIELIHQRTATYQGWLICVKLRNHKGHRKYKKHAPTMVLYEEPLMRYMCPVTWFLSLAFADDVFQNLSSHEDLTKARPPAGSSLYRARYKKDALDRPIMRNTRADGTLFADRIWTYDCFNTALRGVGQRAEESDCTTTSNAVRPQRRRDCAILRLRLCWNRQPIDNTRTRTTPGALQRL